MVFSKDMNEQIEGKEKNVWGWDDWCSKNKKLGASNAQEKEIWRGKKTVK